MNEQSLHVVFDLDDTLYPEVQYAHSALRFAASLIENAFAKENIASQLLQAFSQGEVNPIGIVWARHGLPESALPDVISSMRAHLPDISLRHGVADVLSVLKEMHIGWSILTDGRSITQRQKICALNLRDAQGLYISQERGYSKPDRRAFEQIVRDFPDSAEYVYVADNPAKDFVAPNQMGWKTIMLRDDGSHIHAQDVELPKANHAIITVNCISDVVKHIV